MWNGPLLERGVHEQGIEKTEWLLFVLILVVISFLVPTRLMGGNMIKNCNALEQDNGQWVHHGPRTWNPCQLSGRFPQPWCIRVKHNINHGLR